MSTGTSLWALATLGVIMTTNLLFNLIKKDIFSNCSLSTCFNDTRDINSFKLNIENNNSVVINALVSKFFNITFIYYLFYHRANKIYQNNYVSSLKC